MLVAGGEGPTGAPLDSVEYLPLDDDSARWAEMEPLTRGRSDYPSVGRVLGKLVVLGGRIDDGTRTTITEIEEYNEEKEKWEFREKDKLKEGRYGHSTLMVPESWCPGKEVVPGA